MNDVPSGSIALRGLAPLLAITPCLMAVSPATVGVFVPLYALVWLGFRPQRSLWWQAARSPLSLLLMTVVAWGALSSSWAIDGSLALEKSLKFGLVCLPPLWTAQILRLRGMDATGSARLFLWGMVAGTALLSLQTFGDVLLRDLLLGRDTQHAAIKTNVPSAALAILAWVLPLARSHLAGHSRLVCLLVLAVIGGCTLAGDGLAPVLAFAAGGCCFLLARAAPMSCGALILVGAIAAHIAAPRLQSLELSRGLEASIQHRMDIWALASELSAQRPWSGFGFSNSGVIPAQEGTMALTGFPREFPLYPHNILMQVQLELGIPGVLLFYAFLSLLVWHALKLPPNTRSAGLALIVSALAIWLVGYPLWRSTWVCWLLYCAVGLASLGDGCGHLKQGNPG
jgi:O-antigen ligase